MKFILRIFLSSVLLFSLITCRKEIKTNPISIGTIFNTNKNHFLHDAIKTNDNKYMLCGMVENGLNGHQDGFVMKVDEDFNVIWYKNYGGPANDNFYSMAMDNYGNTLLAGYAWNKDTSTPFLTNAFYNVYIDPEGNILWEKFIEAFPGIINSDNVARKVLSLNDNTFVVMGRTATFFNREDIFCYSLNRSHGDILWTRLFTSDLNYDSLISKQPQNAVRSGDGNIIIVSRNFGNSFSGSNSVCSIKLLKTPANGDTITTNKLIWRGYDFTNLNPDSSGNCLVASDEGYSPAVSSGGDNVLVADNYGGGLANISNEGKLATAIPFSMKLNVIDLNKDDNKIFATSSFPDCFVILDLSGNVLQYSESMYSTINFQKPRVLFQKTFATGKGEYVVFGTEADNAISRIIMLKFNKDLKLKR